MPVFKNASSCNGKKEDREAYKQENIIENK